MYFNLRKEHFDRILQTFEKNIVLSSCGSYIFRLENVILIEIFS